MERIDIIPIKKYKSKQVVYKITTFMNRESICETLEDLFEAVKQELDKFKIL